MDAIKGRGAQKQYANRFDRLSHELRDDYLEHCRLEEEQVSQPFTSYREVFPKSFINKVNSPDVGMSYSANPYQGCEHGCVYCYARNSHEYWGYGAGMDFEKNILVKKEAPRILEREITRNNWKGHTVVFSGNTDCYQPIERKLQITRACLEVMVKWRHPTGIITKNSLVLRDLDLLLRLQEYKAIRVYVSIPTLDEGLRRVLEPRTATIKNRLKTVETLAENGIPVGVMMAPVIPGLTSHEILDIARTVADAGASDIGHIVVRLNGRIGEIFSDWIRIRFPQRSEKVLNQIAECHEGKLNDSEFGRRMKGSGPVAAQIGSMVRLARSRYFNDRKLPAVEATSFLQLKHPQQRLF
jgi:DNA repair photolyase